ncbi:acyltransferase [[Limnothrix rosea] IAM M-220]|uniref:acyltransferase n=1 Tax=[Limnothrix rosea] IAM M-220 TaxID=454133 RepID=UPI000969E1AA|nr:acyltransferase [[Limnothrix rosea] IAM M-220]OKH19905.1 acyltransferase [[Limnothrix rosea] IAM M-220]
MIDLLERIYTGLLSRYRNNYYKLRGVHLSGYSRLQTIEIPRNFDDIEIHENCALDRGVTLLCSGEKTDKPKIQIGAQTYINRHCFFDAAKLIVIGKNCGFGPGCYITDHDHGLDPALAPLEQELISKETIIGDRVWIGANVTILKGVNIGDDAVVGAGSVVTKDIPAQAIAVGNPAKVLRIKGQEK